MKSGGSRRRRVYFIAKSHGETCKEVDDPLKLEKFFPCPEPLSATMTNDTMIPVPDYAESQDQYIQIDELTKRIDILTASTKVVGVYDASAQSLKRVFEEAQEPNLIPVDSWAMFAEKGGLKGAIDWVPIENIAATLKILIEVRTQIIQDLDRTTGISDIMRGTSDARETMGAQRLKTNNSSTRLQERQDEMARFCRDIICIMAEIVSEHYSPETLVQISGAMYDEGLRPACTVPCPSLNTSPMMGHNGGPPMPPAMQQPLGMPPPAQQAPTPLPAGPPMPGAPPVASGMPPQGPPSLGPPGPAAQPMPMGPPPETPEQKMQRKMELIANAIGLLRQDKLRGFRIDIETDSTVQGDAQQEKAQRIEFVEGVTKFIQAAGEVAIQMPEFTPLAAKMLGFAVRGFRVGRDLESAIEDFSDSVEQMAKEKANQPPPPNPEMIKAQSDADLVQHKIRSEGQQQQIDAMKAQAEVQAQQVEAASEKQNAMLEGQRKQMEMEWEGKLKAMDMRMKEMDIHIATIKAQAEERKTQREGAASERDEELSQAKHHSDMAELGVVPKATLNPVAEAIGQIAGHIKSMHDHINAPVEFQRGADGKAVRVRKGNVEREIIRSPDGRVAGLQ